MLASSLLVLTLSVVTGAATAAPDPRLDLLEAMTREGARSMERLRLAGYEAPYFVAYQMKELRHEEVGGRFGAITDDRSRRDRKLWVDVRVGDYQLDSSGRDDVAMFLGPEGQTYFATRDAPLEDDPAALRNALWLLTDEKYKEALSSYFKKKSRRVYRVDEADLAPSFSRETAQHQLDAPLPFSFDRARWRNEVRRLTGLFREHPNVYDSSVKVSAEKQVRWLTSTEGTALVTERTLFGVHVQAVARATDGQLLENSRDFYAPSEGGLPDTARLEREVRALILELEALRTAPAIDPYTGPALLMPEATGVLFHEAVGHRLEGERQDDEKEGQTFKGQLGKQILPAFLTVVDDPTVRDVEGVPLNGSYGFDDQGVAAQRTALVESGILRTFLLSRKPVNPFTRSNGHGRSQGAQNPTARMEPLRVVHPEGVARRSEADAPGRGEAAG